MPVGFTGKFSAAGRTSPTQNFVDCFEMLDGKRIDEGGGDYAYDAQNPYVNPMQVQGTENLAKDAQSTEAEPTENSAEK